MKIQKIKVKTAVVSDKNMTLLHLLDPIAGVTELKNNIFNINISPEKSIKQETIVFIPSVHLNIHKIKHFFLKKKPDPQALLYAIEDQLITDTEQLDLTVMANSKTHQQENLYFTVVYAKQYMADCVDYLKKNHYLPVIVLPDIFALPYLHAENHWALFLTERTVIVRHGYFEGFAIETDNFYLYAQQRLESILAENPGQTITCTLWTTDKAYLQKIDPDFFKNAHLNIHVISENTTFLALATQSLLQPDFYTHIALPCNLLKKNIENTVFSRVLWFKQWRIAISLAGLLLIMLFASSIIKNNFIQANIANINSHISDIYQSLYPGATEMLDPKARMQKDISAGNAQDFWSGLFTIGKVLQAHKNITLNNIRYEKDPQRGQHKFTLAIYTQDFDTIDKLTADLKKQNLIVSASNIVAENKQIAETLSVWVK